MYFALRSAAEQLVRQLRAITRSATWRLTFICALPMALGATLLVLAGYLLLERIDIDTAKQALKPEVDAARIALPQTYAEWVKPGAVDPGTSASDKAAAEFSDLSYQYYAKHEQTPAQRIHVFGWWSIDGRRHSDDTEFTGVVPIRCQWWSWQGLLACLRGTRANTGEDLFFVSWRPGPGAATDAKWGLAQRLSVGSGPDTAYVYVGHRLDLAVARRTLVMNALLFEGLALAVAVVLGFLISRQVLRRVDALNDICDEVAQGNLERRAPGDDVDDEFGELARHVNDMLGRLNRQVRELENFSKHVAHDLRRPMSRLRAALEAVAKSPDLADARTKAQSAIDDTDDILRTFQAILRISQVEVGQTEPPRPMRLDEIVEKAVELFEPVAEDKGVRLVYSAQAAPMLGEPALIEQMAVNFVDNALKFSPPGTEVRVQVAHRNEQVLLSVRDQGPGIPPEDREKATERFVRLASSRGTSGHGLGLAFARAVAERHDTVIRMADAGPGLDISVAFKAA